MRDDSKISVIVLLFLLLIIIFPTSYVLSQVPAGDNIADYKELTDAEKRGFFLKLNEDERIAVFNSMSEIEKQALLKMLSTNEMIVIFENLEDKDKLTLFDAIAEEEKQELFDRLSSIEKRKIFLSASDSEKFEIFNLLSISEKTEYLREFPNLRLILDEQEELLTPAEEAIEEVEPLSEIEKLLSGEYPVVVQHELRQFGYDFFNKEISTFAPVSNVPVGADYVLGPGDFFTIYLWGKTEAVYPVSVLRDGNIIIPRLGKININGLSFSELKNFLHNNFKEYYSDIEMSITMGALRSIDIFIVGEAENAGTYSVSSLSTLVTALFEAGGPNKNGSLRDIRLLRNGELVSSIDLYDFFINGKKTDDVRLQQGDTIFIPVIGAVSGVSGSVKRPAIYEMKDNQTIGSLIDLAGGVLPIGYLQNVVVERISNNQRRMIKSFNLDTHSENAGEDLEELLKDGDLIKIYPVHEKLRQVVYLEGHVKYPREYELKPDMTIKDIIPSYDHLLSEPYLDQAEIIRLIPPDLHPEIIEFNLGKLMEGDNAQNIILRDEDRIQVYGKWEKTDIPEVTITGAVRSPGAYRLYEGMTIKDLIFRAGNLTDKAYLVNGDLTRIISSETGTDILKLSFSPEKAIQGIAEQNPTLLNNDSVFIREIPRYADVLEQKIYLEGAVNFPGEYSFGKDDRLSTIIERAGGLSENAYPFGAKFYRESAKEIQKERLLEYVNKLEQDILTATTTSASAALNKDEAAILQSTVASQQELLKKLKASEPTGRMVINLSEGLLLSSSKYNFTLQAGDRLVVPEKSDYITVMGEVYNPTALFIQNDGDLDHYLNLVGGMTKNADKKEVYIVRADGSVISKRQGGFFGLFSWDQTKSRWAMGNFGSIEMIPGDTIIVPQKIDTYPWMRFFKDTSGILYQLAVTVGVLDSTLDIF